MFDCNVRVNNITSMMQNRNHLGYVAVDKVFHNNFCFNTVNFRLFLLWFVMFSLLICYNLSPDLLCSSLLSLYQNSNAWTRVKENQHINRQSKHATNILNIKIGITITLTWQFRRFVLRVNFHNHFAIKQDLSIEHCY